MTLIIILLFFFCCLNRYRGNLNVTICLQILAFIELNSTFYNCHFSGSFIVKMQKSRFLFRRNKKFSSGSISDHKQVKTFNY